MSEPNAIQELLQVTPQAHGLLFHALKDGNSTYHISVSFDLEVAATEPEIRAVWREIQQSQPALRSVFVWRGIRVPHQVIYEQPRLALEYSCVESAQEATGRCVAWLARCKSTPFNLDIEVFRTACFHNVDSGTLKIAFSFHHILMDGWSSSLLISLWVQRLRKQPIVSVPARSYAQQLWQGMSQEEQTVTREHWRGVVQRLPDGEYSAVTRLLSEPMFRCSDREAPRGKAPGRLVAGSVWDEERRAAIASLCGRAGVTHASFVYLCWALTLAKLTFQKTVAFGCTFSGRGAALTLDAERQPLGLFTNTVPLILTLDGTWPTDRALREVFHVLRQTQQHEKTPPLAVREETALRGELYDCIVVIDNYPIDATLQDASCGAFLTNVHSEETTHFGLTLTVSGQDRWRVELSAGESFVGDPEALKRVFTAFESLATDLLSADAGSAVGDLVLKIHPHEAESSASWVAGKLSVHTPDVNALLSRIHQRLVGSPDAVSLIDGRRGISNRELLGGVCVLQDRLRVSGFLPGDRVAIHLEKGLCSTQVILAILFSGGSYCYINPKDPPLRKKSLLDQARCTLVVSGVTLDRELGAPDSGYLVLDCDTEDSQPPTANEPALWPHRLPEDEFYFIFTSGTTGAPKGISIRNESVANLLDWFVRETQLGSSDRVLGLTDLNFDPSVEDLFGSFVAGATLVYPSGPVLLDRGAFIDLVHDESISVVNFIPGAIAELIQDARFLPAMRLWIFGGEELPQHLRDQLLVQGYAVRNHYGPSETTVDCLSAPQSLDTEVTLGWPIQNVVAYCADAFGKPLPEGVRGELWVGGCAVAHGYATTASGQSFVKSADRTFYRTGDAVTFSRESGFKYLGRIDDQIKMNGVRIEPRELERAVEALQDINACCLLPAIGHNGKRYWRLFVDSRETRATVETRIRACIRQHFPESWMPGRIVVLDGFERTPVGKIDRTRLEERAAQQLRLQSSVSQAVLSDPVEAKVWDIWRDILESEGVATDVNFFDAGGNSLKIVSLQSQLQQAFSLEIGVAVLFEHPTIADLAAWIKERAAGANPAQAGADRSDTGSRPLQEDAERARLGRLRLGDRRNKVKAVAHHHEA
jgi:amino acid adenylation domain-containing protein